jgi:hypothetical protein
LEAGRQGEAIPHCAAAKPQSKIEGQNPKGQSQGKLPPCETYPMCHSLNYRGFAATQCGKALPYRQVSKN